MIVHNSLKKSPRFTNDKHTLFSFWLIDSSFPQNMQSRAADLYPQAVASDGHIQLVKLRRPFLEYIQNQETFSGTDCHGSGCD